MLFSAARDIPDLLPLLIQAPTLEAEAPIEALHTWLREHPHLLCAPVLHHQRLVGIVHTREFIKSMSQQYVRELSRRKRVADFMSREFFAADVTDKITDVLTELLQQDPQLERDSIVVTSRGRYCGTAAVSNLILSLSATQRRLIDQLDTLSRRLSDEVRVTADLQRQLMPQRPLRHGQWTVFGRSQSCSEVGGDVFDYFLLQNRYLVVAIGDASGHGVPAGMLVAAAKAALHSLPEAVLLQPAQALRHLNQAIMATASTVRLMTLFYMVIDTERHLACYANAGHAFPLYHRAVDRSVLLLDDASGMPLGLDEDCEFPARERFIAGGDRLLFLTDGIVEQESLALEPFGHQRVRAIFEQHLAAAPEVLMDVLYRDAASHGGRDSVDDDMTLMVLDLELPVHTTLPSAYVYSLLKAASETGQCAAEIRLRQLGLQVADGTDGAGAQSLFPVPLMTQHFYNSQLHFMPECEPGEHPILLAERPIRMQIANLRSNGIARVLDLRQSILQHIGLEHLLRGRSSDTFLSLPSLFPRIDEWALEHTDDKEPCIARCLALLQDSGLEERRPDIGGTVALLVDEMLENAFLAMPEDERQRRNLAKGTARAMLQGEDLRVQVGYDQRLFAIAISDTWGTFAPHKLLAYFERHRYGGGIVAGEGGGGLYLLWRFADYLHIHVCPGERTTFFVFFGTEGVIDPDQDKSFQLTVTQAD